MNTQISLMYRDADNYKTYHTEVLAGEITAEQVAAVAEALDDGTFLIAEQVGLPTPSFSEVGRRGWPSNASDHVFTTLASFEEALEEGKDLPSLESLLTEDAPTLAMDIATLVERIVGVSEWFVKPEWARMKDAAKHYNPFGGPGQGFGIDGPSVVRP